MESTLIYAQELGLHVIEAGHSITERPGMWSMTRVVQERFGRLEVRHFDSGSWFFPRSRVIWV